MINMIEEIKEVSIESISEKGIEINNRCFTGEDGDGHIFIGSSNISRSAFVV
ncbi:hypothetical protein [Oceanirhabdus seepicola]|uniref:Uncharacterized protein n=1 Tax=Oceanirhabdus seepicola TaxID=2828781 RepID=A0A9J6NXZ2_9CLOT|nr:hypothetical protein [Oceanirhabdus seepicola]MCM1988854.1 hypothetical protein [Oceanirhabdus seepicola]